MWCAVTWCDMIWCDVTWRVVMWRVVTWCDVTWRDVTWRDVIWCGVTWRDVTWRDVMWCDVMWCDVTVSFFFSLKSDKIHVHKNLAFNMGVTQLIFLLGIDQIQNKVIHCHGNCEQVELSVCGRPRYRPHTDSSTCSQLPTVIVPYGFSLIILLCLRLHFLLFRILDSPYFHYSH